MHLWLALLIVVGVTAVSVGGMLLVRRRAPEGTYFKDPIPPGAVYTVVGTAYMVIVAFVFFVGFEGYRAARVDAEDEATATLAMFHAAVPFSPTVRDRLQGEAVCYAREVVADEWPAMREGRSSPVVNARVTAMEVAAARIALEGERELAAYEHWLALNEERRKGRQGRIGQASDLVPPVLWFVLIVGAAVVIGGVGFFADRLEAWLPQVAMIASVAVIVSSGLVLVRFLERPYEDTNGSIKPTAMARTLEEMEDERPQVATSCA
jgi:Protein of unknown function (DUF4239)